MKVACNNCGEILNIAGDQIRYVTCTSCRSRLSVVHEYNAIYTKAMDIATEGLSDSRILHKKIDLERVEREWREEKESRFMVKDKHGTRLISEKILSSYKVTGGIATVVGAVLILGSWMFMEEQGIWITLLLSGVGVVVPLVSFLHNQQLAQQLIDFEQAEAKYKEKKQQIKQRL